MHRLALMCVVSPLLLIVLPGLFIGMTCSHPAVQVISGITWAAIMGNLTGMVKLPDWPFPPIKPQVIV